MIFPVWFKVFRKFPFEKLLAPLQRHVCSFLNAYQLIDLGKCSKTMYQLVQDEEFWKELVNQRLKEGIPEKVLTMYFPSSSYKEEYQKIHRYIKENPRGDIPLMKAIPRPLFLSPLPSAPIDLQPGHNRYHKNPILQEVFKLEPENRGPICYIQ